jgi:hypothetical protein
LAEGIFWTPGQVLRNADGPLPAERLSGFFLVLPINEAAFEPGPQRNPVVDRHEEELQRVARRLRATR